MRIAILVQGRFHAFELERALRERGNDVVLFTNYPKRVVKRWDPDAVVKSFPSHLVLHKVADRAGNKYDALIHKMFGRWGARELKKSDFDVVHCWSGVAEETLLALEGSGTMRLLMRGSAHIRSQQRLLAEEAKRTGLPVPGPFQWNIEREEREYELTDKIVVLSSFALRTFHEEGVPENKLRLLPLGTRVSRFRPEHKTIEDRCSRIRSGGPLRILYVGALSARKGLWDLGVVARRLAGQMEFRCVGASERSTKSLASSLERWIDFKGKVPESSLPDQYSWGDVFIFPTIEDGFAAVLAQAQAAGLPILATPNCSAPDIVIPDRTGWIVPIRDPEALEERLRWCNANRERLAAMIREAAESFQVRSWDEVAADFEKMAQESIADAQPRKNADR